MPAMCMRVGACVRSFQLSSLRGEVAATGSNESFFSRQTNRRILSDLGGDHGWQSSVEREGVVQKVKEDSIRG